MSGTLLNSDSQPIITGFNQQRNINKAVSALRGILEGIVSDGKLNDTEILFLRLWLNEQSGHSGDILDLYEAVEDILEDGIVTKEEHKDLKQLIEDCIKYGPKFTEESERINEFIGFISGISVDDEVNIKEFNKLIDLMNKMDDISDKFPLNVVKRNVETIVEDGIVEPEELAQLCDLLKSISGTDFTNDGVAVGGSTSLFDDEIDAIENKKICLTGKFLTGTRKKVIEELVKLGASVSANVTKDTDILLIGIFSSRDWIHTSAGRKIEKAVKLRENGKNIYISSEARVFQFN